MNMVKKMLVVLIPLALIALLAGCGSTPKKAEPAAEPMEAAPVAVEQEEVPVVTPAPAPMGFTGHPLDDPDSLLSKRVVYFDFDKSDIKSEFRDIIAAHATYLADHPSASITIEGHCDERGSREYNMALGERRANAVRKFLMVQGAMARQIETISYGEERPVAFGHDEASWQLNRRAEILYKSR